jgi:hypothetical protein
MCLREISHEDWRWMELATYCVQCFGISCDKPLVYAMRELVINKMDLFREIACEDRRWMNWLNILSSHMISVAMNLQVLLPES